ncbi:MAG: heat-inducible transcriptional repressor HrcA, partial [Holosporales bacterium]|nr:heat-inducible transcriptional repressor HrcA [Holosporales bacterium]
MSKNNDITTNKRYVEVFKKLVDIYVETGEAVGSRALSKMLPTPLSPATIRNVMSDLEESGILYSDHSSAGRKPTNKGWRFFVDSLIEVSDITEMEKQAVLKIKEEQVGKNVETILKKATDILSDLSNCVSLIMTPTINAKIKHIDFFILSPGRGIVVIVNESGIVENRLIAVPINISQEDLEKATRYINSKLPGMSLEELRNSIQEQFNYQQEGIDKLTKDLVDNGLKLIENDEEASDKIIVNGRSNLIYNSNEIDDLPNLLKKLDEKRMLKTLLDESILGQGIKVFIGSETKIFEMSGCSMIVSPYQNANKTLVGAIGVLGP